MLHEGHPGDHNLTGAINPERSTLGYDYEHEFLWSFTHTDGTAKHTIVSFCTIYSAVEKYTTEHDDIDPWAGQGMQEFRTQPSHTYGSPHSPLTSNAVSLASTVLCLSVWRAHLALN